MSSMKNTGLLLAGALTLALTLGACATPTATGPAAEPTPTQSPTVTQEPTPEPEESVSVEDLQVGDEVPQDLVEDLPDGAAAYPLKGGPTVLVEADKPLPELVVAEIAAKAKSSGHGSSHAESAYKTVALLASRATGKHVIVVGQHLGGLDGVHEPFTSNLYWVVVNRPKGTEYPLIVEKEPLLAWVDSVIAEQENPENFEVIVVEETTSW